MDFRETCRFLCVSYLVWAHTASDERYHKIFSVSLTFLFSWTANTRISYTFFLLGLVWCFILSPFWTPLFIWLRKRLLRKIPHKEVGDEFLPGNCSDDDGRYPIDADVVAVHGLGSHSYTAWGPDSDQTSEESSFLWLRDLLPNEQSISLRVLNPDYNSRWVSQANKKGLSDFADDLLQFIKRKRKTAEKQHRPLILLGHSFGGLVLKQMLVNAQRTLDSEPQNRHLLNSIRGLIFLGTPHTGASSSMIKLAKFLSIFGFWEGSSVAFLKYLEPKTEPIRDLNDAFIDWLRIGCGTNNIYCIAEAAPWKLFWFPTTEIVERESAIIAGCPKKIVEKTHRQLQRIFSREDPPYQDILEYIERWVLNDIKTVEDDFLLSSLRFPEMKNRSNQVDVAHQGTCSWIFEHDSFIEWKEGSCPLLWIKGQPGSGKSTLMTYLSECFCAPFQSKRYCTLQFYFNKRGNEIEVSLEGLLRSLLYQLYDNEPRTRCQIRLNLKKKGSLDGINRKQTTWQQEDLKATFFDALRLITGTTTCILLVDALDEANENQLPAIMSFLRQVQRHQEGTRDSNEILFSLRMCIACRHFPDFVSMAGRKISLEDHNSSDIAAYLEQKLLADELVHANNLDATAWRGIVTEVMQTASTSFQWASLVVKQAYKYVPHGLSIIELRRKLLEMPAELDRMYRYLLQETIEPEYRSKTLFLLQWICLAERPLSVRELRYAMTIEGPALSELDLCCEQMDDFTENDERMAQKVNALTGGLVEVVWFNEDVRDEHNRFSIVQVIHQSVTDFMLTDGLSLLASLTNFLENSNLLTSGIRSEKADMNILHSLQHHLDTDMMRSASHYRMYIACLSYLCIEKADCGEHVQDLKLYPYDRQIAVTKFLVTKPLLEYATKSLFRHLAKAQHFQLLVRSNWAEVVDTVMIVFGMWLENYKLLKEKYELIAENPPSCLLDTAAIYNLEKVAEFLLGNSTQGINGKDVHGNTALHYASKNGNPYIVKLLLQYHAYPNIGNERNRTPLIEAIGTEKCTRGKCPLAPWQEKPPTTEGHFQVIKLLLSIGVDTEVSASVSGTALQEAARHGYKRVVELLLDAGASIDAVSGADGTALTAAALHGHEDIVNLLLERKARVNTVAGRFKTALFAAAWANHEAVADALLRADAKVHILDLRQSPLFIAASRGKKGMFLKLFNFRKQDTYNANMVNKLFCTMGASGSTVLLEHFLQPPFASMIGLATLNQALFLASTNYNTSAVQVLLKAGATVSDADEAPAPADSCLDSGGPFGNALQAAVFKGYTDIINILIQSGANVNIRGGRYGTSLMAAIWACVSKPYSQMSIQHVQDLLDAGADTQMADDHGRSPLQLARHHKLDQVTKLLVTAGAKDEAEEIQTCSTI